MPLVQLPCPDHRLRVSPTPVALTYIPVIHSLERVLIERMIVCATASSSADARKRYEWITLLKIVTHNRVD